MFIIHLLFFSKNSFTSVASGHLLSTFLRFSVADSHLFTVDHGCNAVAIVGVGLDFIEDVEVQFFSAFLAPLVQFTLEVSYIVYALINFIFT